MASQNHRILVACAGRPFTQIVFDAVRLNFTRIVLIGDGDRNPETPDFADGILEIEFVQTPKPALGWTGPVDPRSKLEVTIWEPMRPSDAKIANGGLPEAAELVDTLEASRWPPSARARIAGLRLAAIQTGTLIVPAGYSDLPGSDGRAVADAMLEINALLASELFGLGRSQAWRLSGLDEPVEAWRRSANPDLGDADHAVFVLYNRDDRNSMSIDPRLLTRILGDYVPGSPGADIDAPLQPSECRMFSAWRGCRSKPPAAGSAATAASQPRLVIGAVSPTVDGGRHPAKCSIGTTLRIEADIIMDGHEQLSADIMFKRADAADWSSAPLRHFENDRWIGDIALSGIGRHHFKIEAWFDAWASFVHGLEAKHNAGQDVALEVQEGKMLLQAARDQAAADDSVALGEWLNKLNAATGDAAVAILCADALGGQMRKAAPRAHRIETKIFPIDQERRAAGFASWYELFPRSQTNDAKRHGTFKDVIAELPRIRDMGFDVLYFTPIHPIGRTNRKGRNNTLNAGADEPGSPYAIGSAEGGHEALHPELGTLEDFQALIAAAHAHGLELALDFAIQCSPDHPWLKQHPGWFDWRPDGTIKYAENPPKKYQDIVNVDFYRPDAIPSLWEALRDAVQIWVDRGVRIFRVDNPHTKPLPFWEWLIADIRSRDPGVLFLSEAFTRPKMMYQLAKIGFSQSYSYFTWRNTKAELTDYLTELSTTAPRDFFRPNFFVNTPDINPVFLQTSGRAGFLIRAALATMLSGLWGMYSGFELCEAAPLPGKEEYLDSEKFEIRPRDWKAKGNIVAEITQLNRIRRTEPALQSHLSISFHNAFNDNVLYFAKQAAGEVGKVLVAISLDAFNAQEAAFEVPLWEWGLGDDQSVDVVDLLTGRRFRWTGKMQTVRLHPGAPYAIWRIMPVKA